MTFACPSFAISRTPQASPGCIGAFAYRLVAFLGVLASAVVLWGAANCTNSAPAVSNDAADNTGLLTYVDVLANDTEPDGELMTLAVTGGTCLAAGSVTVEDNLVRFLPSPAVPSACTVTYSATDFQGNSDTGTLTFAAVDVSLIFADNFETGTTGAWDACSGCS